MDLLVAGIEPWTSFITFFVKPLVRDFVPWSTIFWADIFLLFYAVCAFSSEKVFSWIFQFVGPYSTNTGINFIASWSLSWLLVNKQTSWCLQLRFNIHRMSRFSELFNWQIHLWNIYNMFYRRFSLFICSCSLFCLARSRLEQTLASSFALEGSQQYHSKSLAIWRLFLFLH
jgi:hypothetical protein